MTNTTDTYWDVDGVSLQTYAHNIVTLGGSRLAPPPMRGSNIVVPYRPGEVWVEKVVDAKTESLGMWITGANDDGTIPTEPGVRQKFMDNWRELRRLLWNPRKQITLTKRFWVLEEDLIAAGVAVDDLPRSGTGAFTYRLLSASAKGQYAGGLEPSMTGPGRATFVVDIRLSDPYYYSAPISFNLAMSGEATRDVVILGDDQTTDIEIEFTGPLTGPRITNGDVWARYDTGLLTAKKALLSVHDFRARHDTAGANTKSAGYVQHDGDPFWLTLDPGVQTVALTASGGSGSAKITYRPRWH